MFLSLLVCLASVFSPVCQTGLALASLPHQIVSKDLSDQFARTQDVVLANANNDPEVKEGLHSFLCHLQATYEVGEGMIDKDILRILEAIEFAAQKHRHQTRKNPQATPYIIHPIGVADHLLMTGRVRDPDILIGALLHDTVEDTDTSFEEIRLAFGPRVENFVKEVTDDKTLPKMERKQLQIEHAPGKSAGAAQIKLADKWYNLNDLLRSPPADWDKERIDAYFNWAQAVVDALPWVNASLFNSVKLTIATYRGECIICADEETCSFSA